MFGTCAYNSSTLSGSPDINTFFLLSGSANANLSVKTGFGTWLVLYLTFNNSGALVRSGVSQLTTGGADLDLSDTSGSTTFFVAMRYS
jgi:hypothetical protein